MESSMSSVSDNPGTPQSAAPEAAPEIPEVPLDALGREQLSRMAEAGEEILECYRVMHRGGLNVVGEVLRAQGTFYEFDHYPTGDVYDPDSFAQYYYHAHRGLSGEHGHFHTFMRAGGMADGVQAVPYSGDVEWPAGTDALSHLVAVSMNGPGFPIGMFATNRWVTGETWYHADDVKQMVDGFCIDHASPSWPTNRWISAMLVLFRPQVEALLDHRDEVVSGWAARYPERDVYEDRELEITGYLPISVEDQFARVRALLDS